jgi:hypothetical protein
MDGDLDALEFGDEENEDGLDELSEEDDYDLFDNSIEENITSDVKKPVEQTINLSER